MFCTYCEPSHARTSAYAAVNITTFEVLTQPPHVQRRFSKRTRQFWFLEGVSLKAWGPPKGQLQRFPLEVDRGSPLGSSCQHQRPRIMIGREPVPPALFSRTPNLI